MNTQIMELGPIAVIGIEGFCTKNTNVVSELWKTSNVNFSDVAQLGMKEKDGSYVGFWGLMSDVTRNYLPWDNDYSTGYYLAGIEVYNDTPVPDGWTKWILPRRTYLVIEIENNKYQETLWYGIKEEIPKLGYKLSGAVCDYTKPKTGKNSLFFPISKI